MKTNKELVLVPYKIEETNSYRDNIFKTRRGLAVELSTIHALRFPSVEDAHKVAKLGGLKYYEIAGYDPGVEFGDGEVVYTSPEITEAKADEAYRENAVSAAKTEAAKAVENYFANAKWFKLGLAPEWEFRPVMSTKAFGSTWYGLEYRKQGQEPEPGKNYPRTDFSGTWDCGVSDSLGRIIKTRIIEVFLGRFAPASFVAGRPRSVGEYNKQLPNINRRYLWGKNGVKAVAECYTEAEREAMVSFFRGLMDKIETVRKEANDLYKWERYAELEES